MKFGVYFILACVALLWSPLNYAGLTLPDRHLQFQLGDLYIAPAPNNQHIRIQGLIGDEFTTYYSSRLTNRNNIMFGLGYFVDGPCKNNIDLFYGVNAYYLGRLNVTGTVTAESLFTNLSYKYTQTNIPIYLSGKAEFHNDSPEWDDLIVTFDIGIGPNIQPSTFQESSLDGITIPDNIFAGKNNLSSISFSATVGAGLKIKDAILNWPLECGYRFFYLGQNGLEKQTNQVINTLAVPYYAQAVICSVTL